MDSALPGGCLGQILVRNGVKGEGVYLVRRPHSSGAPARRRHLFLPTDPHEDDAGCHVQTADGAGAARLHLRPRPGVACMEDSPHLWLCFSCCICVPTETFPSHAQHSV